MRPGDEVGHDANDCSAIPREHGAAIFRCYLLRCLRVRDKYTIPRRSRNADRLPHVIVNETGRIRVDASVPKADYGLTGSKI